MTHAIGSSVSQDINIGTIITALKDATPLKRFLHAQPISTITIIAVSISTSTNHNTSRGQHRSMLAQADTPTHPPLWSRLSLQNMTKVHNDLDNTWISHRILGRRLGILLSINIGRDIALALLLPRPVEKSILNPKCYISTGVYFRSFVCFGLAHRTAIF